MATTARISNVDHTTTKQALENFLESKHLPLAPGQHISLTAIQDKYKAATVTFADNATFERAIHLPLADRELNNKHISISNNFDGLTILSEGSEVE